MDDITDPTAAPNTRITAPRIPGHRYPTPTGEPCPRTVHVDGTIEQGGNCQSCGTCLLYAGLVDWEVPDPAGEVGAERGTAEE